MSSAPGSRPKSFSICFEIPLHLLTLLQDQPAPERIPVKSRSRSNTATSSKSRKRTQSQASTTSAQSRGHQFTAEQSTANISSVYQKQWYDQPQNERFGSLSHQMTPNDMAINSTPQMQSTQPYDLDPNLGNIISGHGMSYRPDYKMDTNHQPQQQPLSEQYNQTFTDGDSQMVEGRSDEQDEADSVAGGGGATGQGKKASKSSAANELEMRQLFNTNKHRTLPDVAMELHGNERGPQSERQRQVFAMLWYVACPIGADLTNSRDRINQVCDKGKGSVPRGRVYSNYVSRCATERVTVLNPASFGKLVRVLFPGLKTRRLGVRGESKYHYVNFSLKDDQPELVEPQIQQPIQSFTEVPSFTPSFR